MVVAGLLVLVAGIVLVALLFRPPAGVAFGALGAILVLYTAMLVVRFTVRVRRRRLGALAVLMLGIAAVSLGAVLVIGAAA